MIKINSYVYDCSTVGLSQETTSISRYPTYVTGAFMTSKHGNIISDCLLELRNLIPKFRDQGICAEAFFFFLFENRTSASVPVWTLIYSSYRSL